ncbi:nucleotidyltransferase-like protein [Alkalicoccobacillus plakortidis]|uniref:Nucleotidyltransferase-like protein n=1 Tax=Alkalicoccobacillus plakortidis TaxID=444060 RepID=A0ABT0XLF7_9BACI|nr:nucleotidyltransferase-like protein [Alkalicoccobacillus plakortidis]MCM2676748.1 nucleotidyltransferase-like protein [Alkalicoccobacillus plakortidis]
MDMLLRQLYQDQASKEHTCAILVLKKDDSSFLSTDGFDAIILLISDDVTDWYSKHYEAMGKRIAFHTMSQGMMHHSLITGNQRRLIDWLVNGKIVYDRNEFMQDVKVRIDSFPPGDRSKKLTIQFAKLLRRFEEGKTLFNQGYVLDGFSNLFHALHHLARIAVIKDGFYPEVTVWEQVKKIEPEIHKLYQEALNSEEALDKRIELLILALEVSIISKLELGTSHFLELLRSIEGEASIAELLAIPEVQEYRIDLELVLNVLIEKGFVSIVQRETPAKSIFQTKYKIIDFI